MLIFPVSKINLGLSVLAKRKDGFHTMESVLYPVSLCDALELASTSKAFSFDISGDVIPGKKEDNLVVKAYHLLARDYALDPVQIHLHKRIPAGAGLGGGSSDAAAALVGLNTLFSLQLSTEELEHYAAQLGSDCPFFIRSRPALATGRGEKLAPIDPGIGHYQLLVVKPDVHISTAMAYSWITPRSDRPSLSELIRQPVEAWEGRLVNDFEEPIFQRYPEFKDIKEKMKSMGAVYASLTGTGAALYGLFQRAVPLRPPFDFPGCFTWHSATV